MFSSGQKHSFSSCSSAGGAVKVQESSATDVYSFTQRIYATVWDLCVFVTTWTSINVHSLVSLIIRNHTPTRRNCISMSSLHFEFENLEGLHKYYKKSEGGPYVFGVQNLQTGEFIGTQTEMPERGGHAVERARRRFPLPRVQAGDELMFTITLQNRVCLYGNVHVPANEGGGIEKLQLQRNIKKGEQVLAEYNNSGRWFLATINAVFYSQGEEFPTKLSYSLSWSRPHAEDPPRKPEDSPRYVCDDPTLDETIYNVLY